MTGDNLGKSTTWLIKEFPEGLRREIVAAAGIAGVTVGQYLTELVLRGRTGRAAPRQASAAELRDLMTGAAAAAAASGRPMSKRAAQRMERVADDQVRCALGLPPRRPRVAPQLPARKPANRIESVRDSGS